MKHALEEYGWNEWFAERFVPFAELGFRPARVAVEHRTKYELYGETGLIPAVLAGKLRYTATARTALPAVGDWVAAAPRPEGEATIHGVLPRKSSFTRRAAGKLAVGQVAAANIDVVFIVTSMNADFQPRRLERYLAVAHESGATPVVILSKQDLAQDPATFVRRAAEVAAGAPILTTSSVSGEGVEDIRAFLTGHRTGALLGSSGVGKSTLINHLLGEERLDTAEIRAYDGRGRHTTTRRELVPLPGGGLLIDTPGMREMQLHEDEEGLETAFDDVLRLAQSCSFADCSHGPEPGCAVLEAVQAGTLPADRLESFQKLTAERDYDRSKVDKRAAVEAKQKTRVLTKALRARLKNKRG
jgi:ribosome biogenesis GTPase